MPHRPMTPTVAAWIKATHRDNPHLHQHQIAALVGVNQGRVCEVLTGKRFADVAPGYPVDPWNPEAAPS